MVGRQLLSGRDALHRLDDLTATMRAEFDVAVQAASAQRDRRMQITQMKGEGYRQLADLRLDELRDGALSAMTVAEKEAHRLLDEHEAFVEQLTDDAAKAEVEVRAAESERREAEAKVDKAFEAYEDQVAATEERIADLADYQNLKSGYEDAQAVTVRAIEKQKLAEQDRNEKGEPYNTDPLFSYLWKRQFRTPNYEGKGLVRMLDNWVAKLCGYDGAYLNFARLTELPERLQEHVARMELEEAEAEAAIEAFEAQALKDDGAEELSAAVEKARTHLATTDDQLEAAEVKHANLRERQQQAATGDTGPHAQARKLIEDSLEKASFPNLRVLAAETISRDDDDLVDLLVKLRTEELQLEVNEDRVEAVPGIRRAAIDAMEYARNKFKRSGLDNPYVGIAAGAFESAIEAYGRGVDPDGGKLWRALAKTVRRSPRKNDRYFGGRRRRNTIGVPGNMGDIAGVVLEEILREAARGGSRRGGWGARGPWGGGSGRRTGQVKFPRPRSSRPRIGSSRKGGFKTGGRF